MKPLDHAELDVRAFGGTVEDYLDIHNWFDQTKAHIPDMRHRAILHNAWGIFLCEQVFGEYITNGAGKKVSVRTIAERHVLKDLKFIPTFNDCFGDMQMKDWMLGLNRTMRKMVFSSLDMEGPADAKKSIPDR